LYDSADAFGCNGIPGVHFCNSKHTSDAHVDLGSLAENALQQIDEKKYD